MGGAELVWRGRWTPTPAPESVPSLLFEHRDPAIQGDLPGGGWGMEIGVLAHPALPAHLRPLLTMLPLVLAGGSR